MSRHWVWMLVPLLEIACAEEEDPFRYEKLAKGTPKRTHPTASSSGGSAADSTPSRWQPASGGEDSSTFVSGSLNRGGQGEAGGNTGGAHQFGSSPTGGAPTLNGSFSPCMGPEHCAEGEYCDLSNVLAAYDGMTVGLCAR
ncbi:MAG TPA: hypothetical protein VKP30_25335 [Polyangiaceae bacterium]|nr:hypothetical protein [Polyangiaceae bacterium]